MLFLVTDNQPEKNRAFIRPYDINGNRIAGLIIGLDFDSLYIDSLRNEEWSPF